MKAIFEAEFEPEMMIDQESLDKEFDGDWNRFMAYMYKEEGIGMFDEIKFIRCE